MAKISIKKINISDYSKTNQLDISSLARSLNPFMDDIERILRKGLTVEENLPFQYIMFTCEVDVSGIPKTAINLTTSLTTTIKGCIMVHVNNPTVYPSSSPSVVTKINGNKLEVVRVYGLPANTKFDITVLVVS